MQLRTSKPEPGNKFYNTASNGGYSTCIQGNPIDSGCNVLANCVGYACGRFNEIIGSMKYPQLNCNAENFIERAISLGLTVLGPDKTPTAGGIMVWQKGETLSGSDGAGHVAIPERVNNATSVYTSESGYGNSAFWNQTRTKGSGNWGTGTGYTYRGCIANPAAKDEPLQPGQKTYTVQKGDTLSGIAGRYGTTYQELAKINNISDPHKIYVGQVIVLTGASQPAPPPPGQTTYTVKKGDTLSSIARRYGTTWQEIYNKNKTVVGPNPNLIYPGQKLVI